MNRYKYYEEVKALARSVRATYGIDSPRVLRRDVRRIYSKLGIKVDKWPHRLKRLRGAYFNDGGGPTVMVCAGLPAEPMVFTLAHELKHHLCDGKDKSFVGVSTVDNTREVLDIGGEVFAAEFIFPEPDFVAWMQRVGAEPGQATEEHLVRLKHESGTTLSFAGVRKKAEWLGYIPRNAFLKTKWKKLEEQLYGEPLYKRINRRRFGQRGFSAISAK